MWQDGLARALGLDLVRKGEKKVGGGICERPESLRLAWHLVDTDR